MGRLAKWRDRAEKQAAYRGRKGEEEQMVREIVGRLRELRELHQLAQLDPVAMFVEDAPAVEVLRSVARELRVQMTAGGETLAK